MIYSGFPPIYTSDSRLLILGSFPSVQSRRQAFYYGNPRNRFWQVLAEAFGEQLPQTVEQKIRLCTRHGIALWDVVAQCEVVGSSDSSIRNYVTVDLHRVLDRCNVRKILCNGQTAYRLTKGAYDGGIEIVPLPSTSPANVRFDKTLWLNALKIQ